MLTMEVKMLAPALPGSRIKTERCNCVKLINIQSTTVFANGPQLQLCSYLASLRLLPSHSSGSCSQTCGKMHNVSACVLLFSDVPGTGPACCCSKNYCYHQFSTSQSLLIHQNPQQPHHCRF